MRSRTRWGALSRGDPGFPPFRRGRAPVRRMHRTYSSEPRTETLVAEMFPQETEPGVRPGSSWASVTGPFLPAAGRLAACAGPASAARGSGVPLRGEILSRGKASPEPAFFLSVFASPADPALMAHGERGKAVDKRREQPLMHLVPSPDGRTVGHAPRDSVLA
ncbi:hypothetical protein GCM10009549_00730 [Streptomyces thermoalcalitolerans]|uniref:Uncharacterized protein n=1 Tax=Streptomyces thermoalcalitolerans TaxID=65605 RepID=A0ABP3YNR1_9ACTN